MHKDKQSTNTTYCLRKNGNRIKLNNKYQITKPMKTYQIPVTDIQHLMGDRMMDTATLSYDKDGGNPVDALMYAPQTPKLN